MESFMKGTLLDGEDDAGSDSSAAPSYSPGVIPEFMISLFFNTIKNPVFPGQPEHFLRELLMSGVSCFCAVIFLYR